MGTVLDQFGNTDNPLGHYRGTGPEVWKQTNGRITHFLSSMGTTGAPFFILTTGCLHCVLQSTTEVTKAWADACLACIQLSRSLKLCHPCVILCLVHKHSAVVRGCNAAR